MVASKLLSLIDEAQPVAINMSTATSAQLPGNRLSAQFHARRQLARVVRVSLILVETATGSSSLLTVDGFARTLAFDADNNDSFRHHYENGDRRYHAHLRHYYLVYRDSRGHASSRRSVHPCMSVMNL